MNKKIIKTKQALRDALWALIESEDLNEITVSQVCRKADINRTTFYKYYSLPFDILREYVEEICIKVIKTINDKYDTNSETDLYKIMYEISLIYYKNQQIMKVYMEFNKTMLPIVEQFFENQNGLEEHKLSHFISGGVTAIILRWAKHDYKESPEEIARILTLYIHHLYTI